MQTKYVLKRDDGSYYRGQYRGLASVTDDIYETPRYEESGAKFVRGWLRDKARWKPVKITVVIKEAAN